MILDSQNSLSNMPGSGIKQRLLLDRLARNLVSVGGVSVIFSIIAILFVIVAVTWPLFKDPHLELQKKFTIAADSSSPALTIGTDEYREVVYAVYSNRMDFFSLPTASLLFSEPLPEKNNSKVTSVALSDNHFLALGLSDGRVVPVQVEFNVTFADGIRFVNPSLNWMPVFSVTENAHSLEQLAAHRTDNSFTVAASPDGKALVVHKVEERRSLMGEVKLRESSQKLELPDKSRIRALTFHPEGNAIYIGTSAGQILRASWEDLDDDEGTIEFLGSLPQEGVGVATLRFLLGGQTLVVGDQSGGVRSFQVLNRNGRDRLILMHEYSFHKKNVNIVKPSPRNKGFITADTSGTVRFHYATTGQTQFTLPEENREGIREVLISPKADGILLLDEKETLFHWTLDHPHPEISWDTLFGKVHYEGYPQPEYVWQSTGGTDEFEPKFSLIPLLVGTLKGTTYAMFFAVPLALLSAFYTSQFMHDQYKNIVKPVLEIMAALPSVVLGFFAALWLAPNVEKVLPGLFIAPFMILLLIVSYLYGKEFLPKVFPAGKKQGSEVLVIIVLVILAGYLSLWLGFTVERELLQGDYRAWMSNVLHLSYDQRNSLVVGLAMGFAVSPIIFTIAEDSLSNVPGHLKAASLAVGATAWQTALRVILPTASPGIFSAVMIGFGRAIGETMIVLMATGNTPVMDLNIFSGFRALSANIAVELPEAPEGGTLFRILFLAALLLFALTFAVNSFAEWVRLRLRERYRVL